MPKRVAMPSRARTTTALVLASLALAACAPTSESLMPSSPASVAPSVAAPSASAAAGLPITASDDAYYPTAEEIAAAAPGEIIKSVEIHAGTGTRAWFVVYGSTGLDGQPVAVSALILAPEAPPPSNTGYPVVAWAHGTTGIADSCAPSREGIIGVPSNVRSLVSAGYVVTATDYEGLGTDGIHPYLIGTSEGRSVLDSIRAALALPDAHASQQAVVVGFSQGGHAALWAAQLAPTYAPELPMLGAFAASPPTDLPGWETWAFERAKGGHLGAAGAPIMLFGVWNAIYDVPLGFLTDAGRRSARGAVDACDTKMPVATPYARDPAQIGEWRALLVGNSPGAVQTAVPIRVVSPHNDQFVGYDTQVAGVTAMCATGDTVELQAVDGAHDASIATPSAWAAAVAWIGDRFGGVPAVSTCSS